MGFVSVLVCFLARSFLRTERKSREYKEEGREECGFWNFFAVCTSNVNGTHLVGLFFAMQVTFVLSLFEIKREKQNLL